MLGAASPAESQDSSPHNKSPEASDEASVITAEQAVTSAAIDTTASLPTMASLAMTASLPIVTVADGSGAAASRALATTSTG
jgi:hypothetical protein